jgi:hypothetical protein
MIENSVVHNATNLGDSTKAVMNLDSLRRDIEAVVTRADKEGEIDTGFFTIKLARERVGEYG